MPAVRPLAQAAAYVIVPVLLQMALMLLKPPSAAKRKGGLALPLPGTEAELQAGALALDDPSVIWAVYLKLVRTDCAETPLRDAPPMDRIDKND